MVSNAGVSYGPPWTVEYIAMSTPNTIPCLLYFAALFLTVATLWIILLHAAPKGGSSPQDLFVLIGVIMPFVMLIYFGLAVVICDNISVARGWPTALPLQLSSEEFLAVAVPYIGLTVWLCLRWRKLGGLRPGPHLIPDNADAQRTRRTSPGH
jgi:ABC-type Fe3+-siderophore transport system permease subunit